MDELEFCVKSLSYPLGMLLEGAEFKKDDKLRLEKGVVTLPNLPFPVLCYLLARALYLSLDPVDAKRLQDDRQSIEDFAGRLFSSPLRERIQPFLERADEIIEVNKTDRKLSIDWLEFQRRSKKLKPILESMLKGDEPEALPNLSVDECLLLSYLAGERKKRERVNALLGKNNPKFREAVKAYFRALRS